VRDSRKRSAVMFSCTPAAFPEILRSSMIYSRSDNLRRVRSTLSRSLIERVLESAVETRQVGIQTRLINRPYGAQQHLPPRSSFLSPSPFSRFRGSGAIFESSERTLAGALKNDCNSRGTSPIARLNPAYKAAY